MPRLATQPTSSLLLCHKAVSVVKFHCQLFDCLLLGSSPWCGDPPRDAPNTHPEVEQTLWLPGSFPGKLLELVKVPSRVRLAPVPTPKGGLLERMLMASKRSRDSNWPTPVRMAKRPVPNTSHAMPTRGMIM